MIYRSYQLCSAGSCYRTEIVACMTYMTRRDWRNYLLGRSTKGVKAAKSEAVIQQWIRSYIDEAETVIAALDRRISALTLVDGDRGKWDMLSKRWQQIRVLCEEALASIS